MLVGTLGTDALDHRQQQIVDAVSQLGVGAGGDHRDGRVLVGGGIEVERPQALGVGLLHQQRPAHVGMVDDRHARRGLVGHLSEVGALHPRLGEVQRVQVTGRQCRNRLDAHKHSRVFDDLEHLRDAVVGVADQPAGRRHPMLTEGQLGRRRNLQTHLVFQTGHEDTVALARAHRSADRAGIWGPETDSALWCRVRRPAGGPTQYA